MKTTLLVANMGSLRVIVAERDLPETIMVNDEIQCPCDSGVILRFNETDEWSRDYLKALVERALKVE